MEIYDYFFSGKIHPSRVGFSLSRPVPLQLIINGTPGEAEVTIVDSIIEVKYSTPINCLESGTVDIATLKNWIDDSVRLIVDSYCYIKSYAYDVEITSFHCLELDLDVTFNVRGEFNIDKTLEEANSEFTIIMDLFSNPENSFLKDVFADFRRAIKYPAMTASFCFRSIEIIRRHRFEDPTIENENNRRNSGWNELREFCALERVDFEEIEQFALPNRHGSYPFIDYETRERIMNFTRNIIDRILE